MYDNCKTATMNMLQIHGKIGRSSVHRLFIQVYEWVPEDLHPFTDITVGDELPIVCAVESSKSETARVEQHDIPVKGDFMCEQCMG